MEITMLALMICLVMPLKSRQSKSTPLTMMKQSIDDMYDKCNKAMAEAVKNVYFPRENKIEPFQNAWKTASKFAKTKYENRKDKALTLDQVQAIYVYTQEFPSVYKEFNKMVRNGAAHYTSAAFKYHALHFWLTSAIQTINPKKKCQTTYRRTKDKYTGNVNTEMRFGYFASTSKEPDLITFGRETCFKIKTCFGANIESYSSKSKSEVLVPPYEKFKITKTPESLYKNLKDCKKKSLLKSTGTSSNLNCRATNPT